MCIDVVAGVPPDTRLRVGAQALANASGLHVRRSVDEAGISFQFSTNGICSCGLMGEPRDGFPETWYLDAACLDGLATAVALVAKGARELHFCARWLGEEIKPPQGVTLVQLVALIRSNEVRRNVPYRVRARG